MATDNVLVHSNLTDPQLHEPIGISKANENEVYFADGAGHGIWRKPSVADLHLSEKVIPSFVLKDSNNIQKLDNDLEGSFVQANKIIETNSFGDSNRNFNELAIKCEELKTSLTIAHENIAALHKTVMDLREALISLGVLVDG